MIALPDLSLDQERAIELCLDTTERIVSVTGGAGTGKTTVLGAVYAQFREAGYKVVLCAPTGRAAKRIHELTQIPAMTVHRLLEFPQPDDDEPGAPNEPKRNRLYPLEQQVVIVDEASMIGQTLFDQIMAALPSRGLIRFFGDNNQLAPVEEERNAKPQPAPFARMLATRPQVTLLYNFRSNDDIVSNSIRVLQGSIPRRNNRFEIIYSDRPLHQLIAFIRDSREFMRDSHQVIMPTRAGQWGTLRVNPSMQVIYNGAGPMLRLDRFDEAAAPMVLRANDKWLWIKNDYQLNLFNGEIGVVEWIDEDTGSFMLASPDKRQLVPPRLKVYNPYLRAHINYDPRKQIELGYAITTHKAQGSEFGTVIYCMSGHAPFLLGRRNLYTAITRAKEQVIIITDRRGMTLSMRAGR